MVAHPGHSPRNQHRANEQCRHGSQTHIGGYETPMGAKAGEVHAEEGRSQETRSEADESSSEEEAIFACKGAVGCSEEGWREGLIEPFDRSWWAHERGLTAVCRRCLLFRV